MLYDLIRKLKGKEEIMMTDTLTKVEIRKKKFTTSQKGKVNGNRVEYFIRESERDDSWARKPNRMATSGGDPRNHRPARVK